MAKQAIGIGLNKGLTKEFNGVDFVTREEAALYAFNTLKATLVSYDQKITTNVNGVDVTITQGAAKPVTWSEGKNYDGNIKKDTFVQFAEEYFPKLVGKGSSDEFERPATQWIFDKKDIGTFVRWEKMVEKYTTAVSGKDLYDLLTGAVIDDNDVYRYVDGGLVKGFDADKVLARSNKSDLASTDNGILTEVYLDTDEKEIRIVSINTWLAQATVDYNKNTETGTLKIFIEHDAKKDTTTATTETVDVEDVSAVADLTKDEYVLVNRSIKDRTQLQVVAISDVEILEDCTITAFSKTNEDDHYNNSEKAKGLYTSVTTGGEKYDGAAEAHYDASVLNEYDADLLKDNKYNVYLDPYGYVIGVDLFEGTKNYVFIAGYNRSENSNISIETSDAAAIFTDGTMKTIKVNVKDTNKNIDAVNGDKAYSPYFDETKAGQGHNLWVQGGEPNENKWYTYTENNGVYTLKPVKQQSATTVADIPGVANGVGTIDCSKVYLKDSYTDGNGKTRPYAYGDDNSVYLVVSQGAVDTTTEKAITDVDGVYTGVQDVKIEIDSSKIKSDLVTNLNTTNRTYHVDPVYTVYDGDGYVIASVVIGEAQGANKNYAYILSGAKSEGVEDGVTKWTFDAVMNGKKQTLTIIDKFGNTVQNLKPYTVQELMLDGDGKVVKIKDVDDKVTCAHKELDPNKDDVLDVTFAEFFQGRATNDGYNYVSAGKDAGNRDLLTAPDAAGISFTNIVDVQSRTLTFSAMTTVSDKSDHGTDHDDRSNPVALAFEKDAPILVVQKINNETVYQECTSVTEAVSFLNDASAASGRQFRGRVVAMLDGGRAEWAVIINGVTSQSGSTGPVTPDGMVTSLPTSSFKMVNDGVAEIYVPIVNAADDTAVKNSLNTQVQNLLAGQGYYTMTTLSATLSGTTQSATLMAFNGRESLFVKVSYDCFNTLTVNGAVKEWVRHGTQPYTTDTMITNYANNVGTSYVVVKVSYDCFNTLTVNGAVKEWVRHGTQPYTTDTMITNYANNVGTSYVVNGNTTVNPTAYTSTNAKLSAMSNPQTIDTGYVKVVASGNIDKTTTVGTTGVTVFTSATGSNGTNVAVKAGSNITVKVETEANGSATTGSKVSVAVTPTAAAKVSGVQELTLDEVKAGKKLEFTISNIKADITAIAVKAEDYTAPVYATLSACTVDGASKAKVASVEFDKTQVATGDLVKVTVVLTGALNPTQKMTLTLADDASTNATSAWKWDSVQGGLTVSGGGTAALNIASGNEIDGKVVVGYFTVGSVTNTTDKVAVKLTVAES